MERRLEYITIDYNKDTEDFIEFYKSYDTLEHDGWYFNLNTFFINGIVLNFEVYYRPKYKRLVYCNYQNLRLIGSSIHYKSMMWALAGFDYIWDYQNNDLEDWKPELQSKIIRYTEAPKNMHDKFDNYEMSFITCLPGSPLRKNPNFNIHPQSHILTNVKFWINDHDPDLDKVTVYPFSGFGPGTWIMNDCNHMMNRVSQTAREYEHLNNPKVSDRIKGKGSIYIGADVWIGKDCHIVSGASIGHGATIGMGSIVTGKIPPYAIACGCPAKIIKYRFPRWIRNALLDIAWWDWPLWKIYDNLDKIESDNIIGFIETFGSLPKWKLKMHKFFYRVIGK